MHILTCRLLIYSLGMLILLIKLIFRLMHKFSLKVIFFVLLLFWWSEAIAPFFLAEPSRCMFHQQNGRMLVPGGHVQGTSAVTRHECELACVHHTDFTCRSFEFDPDSNSCLLSPDDSYSIPERLGPPSAQGRYFYERGSCIEGKNFNANVNLGNFGDGL